MTDSPELESLRAEVTNLREELNNLRSELATEVRTKRVVVEHEGEEMVVAEVNHLGGGSVKIVGVPSRGLDGEHLTLSMSPATCPSEPSTASVRADIREEHIFHFRFTTTEGLDVYEYHPDDWKPVVP